MGDPKTPNFSIIYSFEILLSWAQNKLIFLSTWLWIKLLWLSQSSDKLRGSLLASYCPKLSGRSKGLAWARGTEFGQVPPVQPELWLPTDPAEGSVVLNYPLRAVCVMNCKSHVIAPRNQWFLSVCNMWFIKSQKETKKLYKMPERASMIIIRMWQGLKLQFYRELWNLHIFYSL